MALSGIKTQSKLSELTGVTTATLSKYLGANRGEFDYPSDETIFRICRGIGKEPEEIIALAEKKPTTIKEQLPTGYYSSNDVADNLRAIEASYRKVDARLHYWSNIFELMPMPACILRDGIVVNQNKLSRELGPAIGKPLCNNCFDTECAGDDCIIKKAVEEHRSIEGYKKTERGYMKVQTSPFRIEQYDYVLVTATPVDECLQHLEENQLMASELGIFAGLPVDIPKYYADEKRTVRFVNQPYLDLFGVTTEPFETADDFHLIIRKRLVRSEKVSAVADDVRANHKPAIVSANLKGGKTIHFLFKPHMVKGEFRVVIAVILDKPLFDYFHDQIEGWIGK